MPDEQTIRIEALKLATSLTGTQSPEILHKQVLGATWTDCRELAETIEAYIKNELPDQIRQ